MSLIFEKQKFLSSDLGGESSLPPLANMRNVQNLTESCLDENDELFIGFGFLSTIFPYKMQDMYDRTLKEREYLTATLENDYLKAVFLPDFGGRLWSLYDKKEGRELLYHNSAIRPCNLALRNAWLAGGIEYNCGMVGHSPFTCSRIFTAETKLDDGTPVLRMYEYERIRGIVYQMDFFLLNDSPLLYGRMRVVNPSAEIVPMYWWTNIAVPGGNKYRNVISADSAFTNLGRKVSKVPVPNFKNIDITYPTNNPVAVDYFWKIQHKERKYTAYLDDKGYGFVQTSTSRLKGRKLFVWGQGKGGDRWQEFLTEDGCDGRYCEIQAGLGYTQYECIPMPPKNAWEWLECYGAINADADIVHGKWELAKAETENRLNQIITEDALENLLTDTYSMAISPAKKMICYGSGWGKLENTRLAYLGKSEICPHLDFGCTDKEQEDWIYLLEKGKLRNESYDTLPKSWMYQKEWTSLIEQSEDSYDKFVHLAAIYFTEKRLKDAEDMCNNALKIFEGPAALFIMSQIKRLGDNDAECALYAERVRKLLPHDISVARMALSALLTAERYELIAGIYSELDENIKEDGRVKMCYCYALLGLGEIDKAEACLNDKGGIIVADIREAETTITDLYLKIEEAKARRDNLPFNAENVCVPKKFDFRMFV